MRIPSDIIRKQICRTLQAFFNESSIVQDVQSKILGLISVMFSKITYSNL